MKKYFLRCVTHKFLIKYVSKFTESTKIIKKWRTENKRLCFLGAETKQPAIPFGLYW